MRPLRHTLSRLLLTLCCSVTASTALAASQPIRLFVGYPPGGSVDTVARLLADPLGKALGTSVLVENRPGAGGRIAAAALATGPADGSIIMLAPNALTTVQTLVYADQITYDMRHDFAPIARVASYPFALSVGADMPVKTPAELNTWLRAHPAQAMFGSPSAGGMAHFAGLMYGKNEKIDWTQIAYKGGAPMLTNLIGGHVAAGVDTLIDHIEQHRAGKIRILGTFSDTRSPLAPDLPTLQEQGITGMLPVEGWFGLFARAGTPPATLQAMDEAVAAILKDPAFVERLGRMVVQPAYLDRNELARVQSRELDDWAVVVRESGFKPE